MRTARMTIPLLLLTVACTLRSHAAGQLTRGSDSETGLLFWEYASDEIVLRLTQRLPDQSRGYFMARGFNAEDAETIAISCVFQSMFKNNHASGSQIVDIDLTQWRVLQAGADSGLKTRENWHALWQQRGVEKPAQIAFEWSLLPTRQSYQPGDYNWGMISFDLPPGSQFDLQFSWSHAGKKRSASLPGIVCPADIHPEPAQ